MKFSYKELSRLVKLDDFTPLTLADRLTFAGFEVEGIEKIAEASKLVIGKILTCVNHPDSDHLHVLTVDCGQEGVLDIVCGAKNARVGIKVIVALVGCELPHLNETIKAGSIRGIISNGMCCSLLELGVDKDSLEEDSPSLDGIEELPDDAKVGEREVLKYLNLDDTILDINVLPNRPDCLSYIGMAREISSLTGNELKEIPSLKLNQQGNIYSSSLSEKCPRFDILKIEDIVSKSETPLYIKRVLLASSIRSISPIVDLGNYIMLLTGQPFNMYDDDNNPTSKYICRDDFESDFTLFDGKKVKCEKGDLVIFSGDEKPLCLAGIMAGENSSITSDSKNIAIEVADFYHANIRHTCNRLGLSSSSSQLFSKSRNPMMIDEAIAVLLSYLDEFFISYKVSGYYSYNAAKKENIPFDFSYDKLNSRLGSSYTKDEIDFVLDRYRIKKVGDKLLPPIDRVDLKEQCDIDEEVFRFYPASKVNPSLSKLPITMGKLTDAQYLKRNIRNLLIDKGLNEILSFTLISKEEDEFIRVFSLAPSYVLLNPMTKDHEVVRSDLLPSMISTINYNLSHQHTDLALFEISDVDTMNGIHTYLSLGLTGQTSLSEKYKATDYTFFDIKGLVECIFSRLGINPTRYRLSYSKNEKFHPKASADIYFGKDLVGTFGQLHPQYFKKKIFVAEIDLGYLFALKGLKTKFTSYVSYPTVRRDLSFKMNDKVNYALLKKTILTCKNSYIKNVEYFDDFISQDASEHYLGVSLILGKEDGTLNDAEISSSLNNIIQTVKSTLSLTLKGE